MLNGVVSALLLLSTLPVWSFPSYDDPVTSDPLLVRPDGRKCAVNLFINATSSYSEVAVTEYQPPVGCLGNMNWSRVILDWNATIKGLQFDRVGAIWIGGVEVLRTTTPEPDPDGITWHIERDLTEYSSYLQSPRNVTLSVLNIVTSKYTGIIYVNVTLTFYAPTAAFPAYTALPDIIPFFADPNDSGNPFTTIQTNVGQSSLLKPGQPHFNRIFLDVYASGHGYDEFWYTNIPDPYAKKLGVPGGGAYRELRVFVNDTFAGSVYPFPVIYTGGVNPLLWRPLTGILSFDIPPYRFDLTPFAGILNGKTSNVTIVLYDDNDQGFWYLDGVFVLYNDIKGATVGGELISVQDTGAIVNVKTSTKKAGFLSFYTKGEHFYTISGLVVSKYGNESVATTVTVHGKLDSENFNTISLDGSIQDTQGHLETVITTKVHHHSRQSLRSGAKNTQRVSRFYYPYDVRQEGAEKNHLLQIKANVLYSREREEKWLPEDGEFFQISWKNTIGSTAFYNRSAGSESYDELRDEVRDEHASTRWYNLMQPSDVIYNQTNDSVETFFITSPDVGLCYSRQMHAVDGTILSATGEFNCSFTGGVTFCGSELCNY